MSLVVTLLYMTLLCAHVFFRAFYVKGRPLLFLLVTLTYEDALSRFIAETGQSTSQAGHLSRS